MPGMILNHGDGLGCSGLRLREDDESAEPHPRAPGKGRRNSGEEEGGERPPLSSCSSPGY